MTGGQSIALTYDPAGLSDAIKAKFPNLASYGALKIAVGDLAKIPDILKGQFAVSAISFGQATCSMPPACRFPVCWMISIPTPATWASTWNGAVPTLKLWAPTAQSVKLHLFADTRPSTTSTVVPMALIRPPAFGASQATSAWKGKFYLYEIKVFAPSTGKIETNLVTDPYSFSLSTNSKRSQIVDLADAALKPAGWDAVAKPPLAAPEDISIYELHVRDFSANDATVPAALRGTYKAFTVADSDGMKHLKALASAGLTHAHLLPAFDFAPINEDKSTWQAPDPAVLATYPPDSEQQQAAVEPRATRMASTGATIRSTTPSPKAATRRTPTARPASSSSARW